MELKIIDDRFSAHAPAKKNILKTILSFQGVTGQVFLGNKLSYKVTEISQYRDLIKKYCALDETTFYVHGCMPVTLGRVKGDPLKPLAISHVQDVMNRVSGLPGASVVHIAKGGTTRLSAVAEVLN